jgi:hypothetical protein
MRLKDIRELRGIALRIWVALVLFALAPEAVASGLDQYPAEPVGHCHGTGPDAHNGGQHQPEIGPTTAPGVAGSSRQVPPAFFSQFPCPRHHKILEIFLAVRIFFMDALAQRRCGFVTLANTQEKPP